MAEPNEGSQVVDPEKDKSIDTPQPSQEEEQVDATTPETPSQDGFGDIEDREPGGTDPTAVYARKQRQERNRLAKQLAVEREARIRMEERLKTIESQRQAPQEEKIWSPSEVRRAVEQGLITQEDATVFLADQTVKQTHKRLEAERRKQEEDARPIMVAQQEIAQYLTIAPYLSDDTDPRTQRIADIYNQNRYAYNLPDNLVTKAMAIKQVLGPVDRLQKQNQSNAMTRDGTKLNAVRPGGGSIDAGKQSDDALLASAPAHFKEMWEKFRTPVKDRVTELKLHYQRHPPKK